MDDLPLEGEDQQFELDPAFEFDAPRWTDLQTSSPSSRSCPSDDIAEDWFSFPHGKHEDSSSAANPFDEALDLEVGFNKEESSNAQIISNPTPRRLQEPSSLITIRTPEKAKSQNVSIVSHSKKTTSGPSSSSSSLSKPSVPSSSSSRTKRPAAAISSSSSSILPQSKPTKAVSSNIISKPASSSLQRPVVAPRKPLVPAAATAPAPSRVAQSKKIIPPSNKIDSKKKKQEPIIEDQEAAAAEDEDEEFDSYSFQRRSTSQMPSIEGEDAKQWQQEVLALLEAGDAKEHAAPAPDTPSPSSSSFASKRSRTSRQQSFQSSSSSSPPQIPNPSSTYQFSSPATASVPMVDQSPLSSLSQRLSVSLSGSLQTPPPHAAPMFISSKKKQNAKSSSSPSAFISSSNNSALPSPPPPPPLLSSSKPASIPCQSAPLDNRKRKAFTVHSEEDAIEQEKPPVQQQQWPFSFPTSFPTAFPSAPAIAASRVPLSSVSNANPIIPIPQKDDNPRNAKMRRFQPPSAMALVDGKENASGLTSKAQRVLPSESDESAIPAKLLAEVQSENSTRKIAASSVSFCFAPTKTKQLGSKQASAKPAPAASVKIPGPSSSLVINSAAAPSSSVAKASVKPSAAATKPEDELSLLIAKHKQKFAPVPEPSVKQVKQWEEASGRKWFSLPAEERDRVNAEIAGRLQL